MISNVSSNSNIEKYTIAHQDLNGNPVKINDVYCRILKVDGSKYNLLTVRTSVAVDSEIYDSGLKFIRLRSHKIITARAFFKDLIFKASINKRIIIIQNGK